MESSGRGFAKVESIAAQIAEQALIAGQRLANQAPRA
jgi:hypothetical protein